MADQEERPRRFIACEWLGQLGACVLEWTRICCFGMVYPKPESDAPLIRKEEGEDTEPETRLRRIPGQPSDFDF